MRDPIGRQSVSFLADGLATTTHRANSRNDTALWGDMRSPNHANTRAQGDAHVAVHSH